MYVKYVWIYKKKKITGDPRNWIFSLFIHNCNSNVRTLVLITVLHLVQSWRNTFRLILRAYKFYPRAIDIPFWDTVYSSSRRTSFYFGKHRSWNFNQWNFYYRLSVSPTIRNTIGRYINFLYFAARYHGIGDSWAGQSRDLERVLRDKTLIA